METKITPLGGHDAYDLVKHLENNSPLIIEEVRRWCDLLWDDYLDYKYRQKRQTEVHTPLQDTPPIY
jgi:hypothetical protein